MVPPKHDRLEQLFTSALKRDTWEERQAFLREECGDDPELRGHVERLLRARDRMGSFLETPPVDPAGLLDIQDGEEATGTRIGAYEILQKIGEGGFGAVYLAEQHEPVRRKVALKIIKLGMDTKEVIARFEAERQALALMSHPNIAAVLDAGATAEGRPYFVMELVRGVPITDYARRARLSTTDRLKLLLPVCHAVQHAHQKGILHRDLKPSNVLVKLDDGRPVPMVIDFGMAKAIHAKLTERTLFTGFREFLGTPAYVSPDQVETSGHDVDTRADVYSLGVLLYELLTGSTPFDTAEPRATTFEEIRRVIRDVDPPAPSARLAQISASGQLEAQAREQDTDPALLVRRVHGDLDWITMKALEKDRTRRYATAKELADDLERHLRDEPVAARPPRASYKVRKFIRRHRTGVAAASVVAAALVIGLSLATAGLIQANRSRAELRLERDAAEAARSREADQRHQAEAAAAQARREAVKAATVGDFLQEMLRAVDPSQALGREVTVRYVLDEAARRIDEGVLAGEPEVEASIRTTLGETYLALGRHPEAREHLLEASAIRERVLGRDHPDTLRANRLLARLLRSEGKFSAAESLLRRTLEAQLRSLGEEDPETLSTANELALSLWGPGRFEEAEAIHRRTLDIQRRVLGEDHADTIASEGSLGAVCRARGKTEEAERLLRDALDRCRRTLSEDHPLFAELEIEMGLLQEDRGEYEEAEGSYAAAHDLDRRILGPDHPRTLIPMNHLLRVLHLEGKSEAIRPLLVERLGHLRRIAERPGASANSLHAYAWELLHCEARDLRDPAAALPLARRAVEQDGGKDASLLVTLAEAQRRTGDLEGAIDAQRRAVALARSGGPYNSAEMEATLVQYLLARGDLVGAAGVSLEDLTSSLGQTLFPGEAPGDSLIRQSEELIGKGRLAEAAETLRGCLALLQKTLPPDHWRIADATCRLGATLASAGDLAQAEPLLLEGIEDLQRRPDAPPARRHAALEAVVRLYRELGRPGEAARWSARLSGETAKESHKPKEREP